MRQPENQEELEELQREPMRAALVMAAFFVAIFAVLILLGSSK